MLRAMPFEGTPAGDRLLAAKDAAEAEKTGMLKAGTVNGVAAGNAANRHTVTVSKAPDNLYPTSILSLVSAALKLSRQSKIPQGRKTWRGFGGLQLDKQWYVKDSRGVTTGVELGFMSTTLDPRVATEYSGVKRGQAGMVMEFDVGAVDLGAQLGDVSQYPGGQN